MSGEGVHRWGSILILVLVVQLPKPQVEKQFEDRPAVASCVHFQPQAPMYPETSSVPTCLGSQGELVWMDFNHFYIHIFTFSPCLICVAALDHGSNSIWSQFSCDPMNIHEFTSRFTSTKHHFSPKPPQPIQDCGRSVGHVSELRKVQLSQAMRRAREQLSERLEMSKMTASQLETWRWLRGWRTGWRTMWLRLLDIWDVNKS